MQEIDIDGPFDGLFQIFDWYKAHIHTESNLLVMAEAQKVYSSFETCSNDTLEIWLKLKGRYGSPGQDENQTWWFDIGNQQIVSVDCRIYGESGKIALNMTAVDSTLVNAISAE